MAQKTIILLWNNSLCLQNKLKNKHINPLLTPPVTPTPLSPSPLQFLMGLIELWPVFFYRHSLSRLISSGWGPSCSLGAVRDGYFDDHFTARPGWAVWLLPGVCWSWWRRKEQKVRCWSACSRSHLLVHQTASTDTHVSGRCRDHMPPPTRKKVPLSYFP